MARTSTDAAAVAALAATQAQAGPVTDFVNTLPVFVGDQEFHVCPNFALLQRVERAVGGVIPFIDRIAQRRHSIAEVAAAMTQIITMQPRAPKAADIPELLHKQPAPAGKETGGYVYYTGFLLQILSLAVTGGVVPKEEDAGNGAAPAEDGAAA